MKEKRPYKKILILLIVIVLALFTSFYFVYEDIKARNEHIGQLNQEIASQYKRNNYLLNLQKTLQNTDSDIVRINNSIIPSDGDIKFIEDLEKTAKAYGLSLSINSLVFEDGQGFSSSNIHVFKVRAETNGPWSSTYKFLAQLESMPLKVKVNNFSLSGSVQNSSPESKSSKVSSVWRSVFDISILKYK